MKMILLGIAASLGIGTLHAVEANLPAPVVELSGKTAPPTGPLCLWYQTPARDWVSALPVGNGRLGAMIFGGVNQERLQLNEDTLWAGGPYNPVNPDAKAALPEVRKLVFDGKYSAAARLVGEKVLAKPLRQMPYETVGNLLLSFPNVAKAENYRRDLNLDTAVASVRYTVAGVTFTREVFSSPVDQVIVVRLSADKAGSISFTAEINSPQNSNVSLDSDNTLVLAGENGEANGIKGALKFQSRAQVLAKGGKIISGDHTITVTNADSATLLIAAATSYKSFKDVSGDPEAIVKKQIAAAGRKSFAKLLKASVAEHQRLFRRVSLDLGSSDSMKLPTDQRIQKFAEGNDAQFAALYYQYGRYLLIGSSRPGTQPAGLQGIWNDSMNPPWGGKYTININTEMNYWPAETANLSECVDPLIQMVTELSETGARTATEMYGARGWVTHHNTDLWRASAPIDGPNYGMWQTGGAWLCDHLWDHYEFTGDRKYLAKVYPVLRGAAEFFLDTLVEEPTHKWLVTNPSLSPENPHPFGAAICAGPTMDNQILRDLFANTIKASEILGVDENLRKQLAETRARLAPNQIGKAGQLQEWLADWDMNAKDLHHRHVSHLYGLYPSWEINVFDTPDFAASAKKSLEIRGDRATGWATAWRINLWARLHDGDHAFEILKFLLSPERTYPNMFDAHPPFQIDGNFGGASGITEMLVQSRPLAAGDSKFEIEFLPALPKAWPAGSIQGLRARGGFEVDLKWKDGKFTAATVRSLTGNPVRLRNGQTTHDLKLKAGKSFQWNAQ